MGFRRPLLFAACAVAMAAVPAGAAAAGSGTASPGFHPPGHHYLALGDSLAFGYHDAQFVAEVSSGTYDPASFNAGYVDDFAATMQQVRPGLDTTNMGCPGETASTMLGLGDPGNAFAPPNCLFHYGFALHASFPASQSQMSAALDFLAANPRDTSPISLDIGANDLINMIRGCSFDGACIVAALPGLEAGFAANLDTILTGLHNAAPTAEVLVMNVPDVFEFVAPRTIPVFQSFDAALGAVVAAHRMRLVDAFTPVLAFYTNGDVVGFCSLSAFCSTSPPDIHPNAAGYAVLGGLFWQASGYSRLLS